MYREDHYAVSLEDSMISHASKSPKSVPMRIHTDDELSDDDSDSHKLPLAQKIDTGKAIVGSPTQEDIAGPSFSQITAPIVTSPEDTSNRRLSSPLAAEPEAKTPQSQKIIAPQIHETPSMPIPTSQQKRYSTGTIPSASSKILSGSTGVVRVTPPPQQPKMLRSLLRSTTISSSLPSSNNSSSKQKWRMRAGRSSVSETMSPLSPLQHSLPGAGSSSRSYRSAENMSEGYRDDYRDDILSDEEDNDLLSDDESYTPSGGSIRVFSAKSSASLAKAMKSRRNISEQSPLLPK
jgi:hypothetical protein